LADNYLHIALVGNPNSGKTSLFNALTGLNQKVGNFPGVTVDKKTGACLIEEIEASILDLPGTYSLYPRREDEWVAYKVLMQVDETVGKPQIVLLVADASNLKRNLLFCSQMLDLNIPVVVALTMNDLAKQKGIEIDLPGLERELGVQIVPINPRKNKGIGALKKAIHNCYKQLPIKHNAPFVANNEITHKPVAALQQLLPQLNDYAAIHYLINYSHFKLNSNEEAVIATIVKENNFNHTKVQAEEILQRFKRISSIMQKNVIEPDPLQQKLTTEKLDNIFLHRTYGYAILLATLFILFQSIFWLAQYPMDAIEVSFSTITSWLSTNLPNTWWSNLFINGFVAGLSGILIFVPQIMILFGIITILEDTGYMARISFLSDKLMRKVGLNGKSVMPMISGFACAVPAIMSARNIENKNERLLTILITPLMSCSARLPVFTILIALVIPNTYFLGFISLQGLVLMILYLLGTTIALAVSYVLKFFIRSQERSFFILELPTYRMPRWKNVGVTMIEKAKIFIFDAGKVIIVISLIIWFLSNYGPTKKMEAIDAAYAAQVESVTYKMDSASVEKAYKTERLQNSFAGILGSAIEPAIKPLGYDWKIGIALITSFAAREVFVGTMATLYSVDEEDSSSLKTKMQQAHWPNGKPVYTLATALSLMIFYLLAMQCMSTLAIVKRETKSWKWPIFQFVYMTALAYGLSFAVYQLFS